MSPSLVELGDVSKALSGRIAGRLAGGKSAKPYASGWTAPDWLRAPKSSGPGKVDPQAASRKAKQVGTPRGNPLRDTGGTRNPARLTRADPGMKRGAAHRRRTAYQPGTGGDWRTPGDWA